MTTRFAHDPLFLCFGLLSPKSIKDTLRSVPLRYDTTSTLRLDRWRTTLIPSLQSAWKLRSAHAIEERRAFGWMVGRALCKIWGYPCLKAGVIDLTLPTLLVTMIMDLSKNTEWSLCSACLTNRFRCSGIDVNKTPQPDAHDSPNSCWKTRNLCHRWLSNNPYLQFRKLCIFICIERLASQRRLWFQCWKTQHPNFHCHVHEKKNLS